MSPVVDERDAWLFLNRVPDLGPLRFHQLLHVTRSAQVILQSKAQDLMQAGIFESLARQWERCFQDTDLWDAWEQDRQRMDQGLFGAVTELDPDYPSPLRNVVDRPPVLYYKGCWPIPDHVTVGLVGMRKASAYGVRVTEQLTTELVHQGCMTVSGMARGIDTCVHQKTLEKRGYTVAVLGNGFSCIYPPENKKLQSRIVEQGTVLTEFPFEAVPDARHFPRRNRIISGLSRGIVVVEAGQTSGALITARYAAEQGKDVFVVPGDIFREGSQGCHRLIKEGARLITSAKEILEEWEIKMSSPTPLQRWRSPETQCRNVSIGDETSRPGMGLTSVEDQLYRLLSPAPLSLDRLVHETGRPFEELADALLSLELKGMVKQLPAQHYAINP